MTSLVDTHREIFGITAFRAGQREAIDAFLGGRDVAVHLPTGAGKSLCYQLPALVRARQEGLATLVVSPLIALMEDQVAALVARGVPAVALHGADNAQGQRMRRDASTHAALIYTSPERLAHASARRAILRLGIGAIAIDEAHCISQWGHDFRPAYRTLSVLKTEWDLPMMALSATATPRVWSDVMEVLGLADPVHIHASIRRDNLAMSVEHVRGHTARAARAADLVQAAGLQRGDAGRVIVYAATRKRVKDVVDAFKSRGIRAVYYHAGRSDAARAKAQDDFTTGRQHVIVATNAFGMGVDLPDVRLVIHVEAPDSPEAYWQEAGRAGRDGLPARGVLLYSPVDAVTRRRLRGASPPEGSEARWRGMEAYVHADTCRQAWISAWFGDKQGTPCGQCDVCRDAQGVQQANQQARTLKETRKQARRAVEQVQLHDGQLDQIVAFVDALRRPLGRGVIVAALRGSRSKVVKKRGLLKHADHGVLRGIAEPSIFAAIDQLVACGRLVPKGKKYPTLWVADKAVRAARSTTPSRPKREGLALRLSSFRDREAKRRHWKRFQVFPNATLEAIVKERPQNTRELLDIVGMGPVRVSRFGDEILSLIRQVDTTDAQPRVSRASMASGQEDEP